MADILAALDDLENEERKKKSTATQNNRRKGSTSSGRSGGRSRHRVSTQSLPTEPVKPISTGRLTPIPPHRPNAPSPPEGRSRESSVGGDSRRISFAEAPKPPTKRYYIPTKTASLASGFPYITQLGRWGVTLSEWEDFSDAVVDAANISSPSWAWFMHRKEVIRRLKRELQYEGDFKRLLRQWNKHFKRKGFQAWLELPVQRGEPARSQSADQENSSDEDSDQAEARKNAKKYSKRFRMVVSNNVEKGSSVYSRTSSLTRSITGEGVNMQQKAAQKAHEKATEHAAQQDNDEDEGGQTVDYEKDDTPIEVVIDKPVEEKMVKDDNEQK